ncbi:MAG: SDR family NAD(P)-dependent oxidoreductase [Halieaceae bacterium]|nr:SDR family NAD(P)-dependent oxidoreductase [Halieaceae bacterium]
MQNKVAVITGASSGVGLAVAKLLLSQGWTVIATGRDPQRCESAEQELLELTTRPEQIIMMRTELGELTQTAQLAAAVSEQANQVDALINNAGGVCADYQLTTEGVEGTLAGNHLGHFLLTLRLMPLLEQAALNNQSPARVINVSSNAHEYYPGFDWDDLAMNAGYDAGIAYCRAKFANVMFTQELARRSSATTLVAHAVHPGVVSSNFTSNVPDDMRARMSDLSSLSADVPAKTIVLLAASSSGATGSGSYWHEGELKPASQAACDPTEGAKLWAVSLDLVKPFV